MSKFILPKTNSTYREAAVPKAGELLFDTNNKQVYAGDGTTPGGVALSVGGGTAGDLAGGFNIEIVGGSTVGQKRFKPIETLVSGGTVFAGHAYKITATSGSTVNAELFDRGITGLDATLEIYLNGTGYLHTGNNLVIKGQLEPDAINNCVVRFHDGDAVLEVLDNTGGYIVTKASGSTAGTLVYGLTDVSSGYSPYIVFNQELNGTPIDFAGTEVTDERHVVGNGYENTILGGTVSIGGGTAGKLTLAALTASNLVVGSGGAVTLGDVKIPSGSTVAVSGGGLAIGKVSGNNGTIDLGGTALSFSSVANVENVVIESGYGALSPVYAQHVEVSLVGCSVTSCAGTNKAGALSFIGSGNLIAESCTFSGNSCTNAGCLDIEPGAGYTAVLSSCTVESNTGAGFTRGMQVAGSGTVLLKDCTFGLNPEQRIYNTGNIVLSGGVRLADINGTGKVEVKSGTTIDITGNTRSQVIYPSGGITFESGGATVLYSSGAVFGSYMMDNVTLPAGAKLTNTAVVDLGGTQLVFFAGESPDIAGCTIANGSGTQMLGKAVGGDGGSRYIHLKSCTFDNTNNGYLFAKDGTQITASGCTFADETANYQFRFFENNGILSFHDCDLGKNGIFCNVGSLSFAGSNSFRGYINANSASVAPHVTFSSGAVLDLTGNNYPTPIDGGDNGIIVSGGCTVINSAGASVSIAGGTYTKINNDGTTA